MFNAFRQAFGVKCTARANAFIFALKQIPIIKKLIPQEAYSARVLKVLAVIVIAILEIGLTFGTKAIYLGGVVLCPALLIAEMGLPKSRVFLHIFFFLTLVGGFGNNKLFDRSKLAYHTVNLLRMDARKYTLSNFAYQQIRFLVGFLPFTLLFGMLADVPLWLCLLMPFSVVGSKLAGSALSLWWENRFGYTFEDTKANKLTTIAAILLLAAAYFPQILGFALPQAVSAFLILSLIPVGFLCLKPVLGFAHYKTVTRRIQLNTMNQMDASKDVLKRNAEKHITADPNVTSSRSGFEFLNELFVKRHRKILWDTTSKIALVLCAVLAGILLVVWRMPDARPGINEVMMTKLPFLWFLLYALNRGTGFTQACFMNCDHSLLTYPFFKKPGSILRLFRIRLREIAKINAVPAAILGGGMALLLALTGGTDNPLNYAVLIAAPVAMSMFFSIHYLMLYYLLQPYTAGTQMKGGLYSLCTGATYFVCYMLMQMKLPTLMFGLVCILFCVVYCPVAYLLVYKLAPKTFRLHS